MKSREVAALIGRSPALVLAWCRAGRLPGATHEGRVWSIPDAAVPVLLARNTVPGRRNIAGQSRAAATVQPGAGAVVAPLPAEYDQMSSSDGSGAEGYYHPYDGGR